MSLGGFALEEDAVDGDWESFNYCTAETYYDAMLGEEWDLIDDVCFDCIENIANWLGYCDELYEQNEATIKKILSGTFITVNNRTFIDAIVEERKVDLAEAYIILGSMDIRLYILHMFYFEDKWNIGTINDVYGGTILNRACRNFSSRDSVIQFLSNLFTELVNIYENLDDEQQIPFLNVVRSNIKNIKYSGKFPKVNLGDVCSAGFARVLKNK